MAREAPLDGLNGGIWNILKKMLLLDGRLRGANLRNRQI